MWQGRRDHHAAGRPLLFDLTALCHPAWWVALAVLLVNDNLLKGTGIVPGWLTGKLSDFAFLVVAPVLLTALLPLCLRGRRMVAFVLVVSVYAAADLSPAASDAIVALAAKLGLHWRLWPDLTDLVALSVLPGSWSIAGRRQIGVLGGRRRLVETAGVLVGALACVATSAPPEYEHYPFLVNQTDTPQSITFTWILEKVPCDADLAAVAATLTADDVAEPHTETLASGQVAALNEAPAAGTVLAGKCEPEKTSYSSYHSTTENCSTTIVSVAGGPDVLVSAPRLWWEYAKEGTPLSCSESSPPESECEPTMSISKWAGRDALSLRLENGALAFKANEKLKMVVVSLAEILGKPGDGTGCASQREQLGALLEGARSCVVDADCYAVQANIDVPGESLCNVYVNRSLSAATLAQRRASWNRQCETHKEYSCGGGLAQPPVCRAGRCEEACPGERVPGCDTPCTSWNLPSPPDCAGREGSRCATTDGQRCVCAGTPAKLSCEPLTPVSVTCPLACTTYYATSSPTIASDAGVAQRLDSGRPDLGADARGAALDSSPVDR